MKMMETFNEQHLEKSLRELAPWKRVAFMAQVGARMLPNFQKFSSETGFGDISILKRSFDVIWNWIEFGILSENIKALIKSCEDQRPHTERFHSKYSSAALDAANAVAATLEAIDSPEKGRLVEVASLARDTIDLFVQELMNLDPNQPFFEEAILRHDLMQRELRCQKEDLEILVKSSGDRQSQGSRLRLRAAAQNIGSLHEQSAS